MALVRSQSIAAMQDVTLGMAAAKKLESKLNLFVKQAELEI